MYNPYGCEGQTDYPHKSTHQSGNANVVARTTCPAPHLMAEIYVSTQLYKRSCSGFTCEWNVYGPHEHELKENARTAQTNSAGPCVNGRYKGVSAHYIIDAEGDLYFAITQKAANINTC